MTNHDDERQLEACTVQVRVNVQEQPTRSTVKIYVRDSQYRYTYDINDVGAKASTRA
jgi:hypothetical protein